MGTIGLDDPTVFNRTAVYNLSAPLNLPATSFLSAGSGTQVNSYAGVHAPDVVGNIRIDQAWGLFQISAAAHEVSGSYNALGLSGLPTGLAPGVQAAFTAGDFTGLVPFGPSEPSGHPASKWGGSVMAALQIKNIPTGAGDDIKMDASYAKGDTKNVISTSSTSPNFLMFGGTGRPGAYQSFGFGVATDAIWLPAGFVSAALGPASGLGDGRLHLTEAYGFRGAFNHNWDPYWSSSLFGSASAVRYDSTAKFFYCSAYTFASGGGGLAGKSADYSCNPDYNVYQLGLVTRWTPVKNLTFSAEVQWFHLDQKFTGATAITTIQPKPNGVNLEFKDQDTVALNVRVQRNF